MLYYNFCNYDGFKNLFGIQHQGNGVKSRKNKILLSYIKNKELLHNAGTTGDYHLLRKYPKKCIETRNKILNNLQWNRKWLNLL